MKLVIIAFFSILFLLVAIIIFGTDRKVIISPFLEEIPVVDRFTIKPTPVENYSPRTISISSIFNSDHSWTATLSATKKITMIATGDVIPARMVNFLETQKKDFLWPWVKTADVLKSADLTLVNLEAPLMEKCIPTQTGMVFCGDKRNIEGLVYAGIDVVNLANNHGENYGSSGVSETSDLLKTNGILATGVDGPIYKNIKGINFAFLGYSDFSGSAISTVNEDKIAGEIAEAREQADMVVISFHWGVEYTHTPTERQRTLAHLAVDSGADLVIGNHPHWVQAVELYKDKFIAFAHGNFIFDQTWSQKTMEGVVGKYTFYDKKLVDVELLPVVIKDGAQPDWADEIVSNRILGEIKSVSF